MKAITYKGAPYKLVGSSKYGAKVLSADLSKMIAHTKSFLDGTKSSSSNPQVAIQRAKAEAKLDVLEALLSDSDWNIFKNIHLHP